MPSHFSKTVGYSNAKQPKISIRECVLLPSQSSPTASNHSRKISCINEQLEKKKQTSNRSSDDKSPICVGSSTRHCTAPLLLRTKIFVLNILGTTNAYEWEHFCIDKVYMISFLQMTHFDCRLITGRSLVQILAAPTSQSQARIQPKETEPWAAPDAFISVFLWMLDETYKKVRIELLKWAQP